MSRTLRVLNVEDSERDVALLKRHLTQAGYDLITTRVEEPEAMKAALASQEWDLILCDYSMPHFNALQALAVLKESGLDLPLVIISGTVGEAVAVEAMRAGAHDYLMKDNLARLAPTIERELHEAENRRARRQAEEAFKQSEAELLAIFEAMTDVILVFDAEGRHLKMAPTRASVVYKPAAERIGKMLHEVYPPQTAELFLENIRRALTEGQTQRLEYSLEIAGRETWFEGTVSPMTENSVIWVARDISARKAADLEQARLIAQIESHRERLDNIVASVPGVVWEAWGEPDATTQRTDFVSDHVEIMLGYSVREWLSVPNFWLSIVHPDDREQAALTAAEEFNSGKGNFAMEFRWLAKDGRALWVQSNAVVVADQQGRPIGLRGVTIDITERKRLEEQFRQSQKLEAIGLLAGGIAHDFNNLLTVISGYSDITLRRMREEDPVHRNISEVKKAAERAAGLTRQLLAFSRKQVMQPKVLNLNNVIAELEKMLRRLIGEDVALHTAPQPELGSVKADPGQIEQIIMNLAINARDAMPRGGNLTIETANVYLDDEYARNHIAVTAGPFVLLAISDTGTGMDQETQTRAFEPFFTTKESGRGTGLGLSTVYGIVKQSGGNIWVYSELGRGTTFKIYLPRVDEGAQEYERAESEGATQGTETVLLAEDEEAVRKLARQILEMYGYHVLEAANGGAALLLCERHRGSIQLLITDVVMPEMSGRELADRLARLHPEMKVLFMSGYTDNAVVHHGVLIGETNFIQKPFPTEGLVRKVREVLDTPKKSN
jgi:PAS domain S-box-containing protein